MLEETFLYSHPTETSGKLLTLSMTQTMSSESRATSMTQRLLTSPCTMIKKETKVLKLFRTKMELDFKLLDTFIDKQLNNSISI